MVDCWAGVQGLAAVTRHAAAGDDLPAVRAPQSSG